jgi:hypothetical protein
VILVIPSRGRPTRALETATSARLHATDSDSLEIVIVIDDTDPELQWYRDTFTQKRRTWLWVLEGRHRYTEALNAAAFSDFGRAHGILGAFGDDVLFRTFGWDQVVVKALSMPGIAYGDDLVHGVNHPTAVFMSRAIVDALGWLALPATKHQWADDGWKRLGQETKCLRFMPDVIVEHMHPTAGKAEWDATYESVFDGEAAKADYEGFQAWVESGLEADVRKVRRVVRYPSRSSRRRPAV